MRCPTCKRQLEPEAEPEGRKFAPFCSERCKLIDLGKWLGEDYRVPEGPDGSADVPKTDD